MPGGGSCFWLRNRGPGERMGREWGFGEKTTFDISCKLSLETICLKGQILLPGENKIFQCQNLCRCFFFFWRRVGHDSVKMMPTLERNKTSMMASMIKNHKRKQECKKRWEKKYACHRNEAHDLLSKRTYKWMWNLSPLPSALQLEIDKIPIWKTNL